MADAQATHENWLGTLSTQFQERLDVEKVAAMAVLVETFDGKIGDV